VSTAATHRLLAALDEFQTVHGRDEAYAELVGQLRDLTPKVTATMGSDAQAASPGQQAAKDATTDPIKVAASMAAAKAAAPASKPAEDQPKTFQEAASAAREHLATARGESAT
jgi:hypothetical protein